MPVPYSFHSKVQEKEIVRNGTHRYKGHHKDLMPVQGVEIIDGAVCIDHVYLCVNIPPKISVSSFMGYLKGKSALMIFDRHPELQNKWNKAFWARGYYVSTVGNVTEEAIKRYIQEQEEESKQEEAAFERQ